MLRGAADGLFTTKAPRAPKKNGVGPTRAASVFWRQSEPVERLYWGHEQRISNQDSQPISIYPQANAAGHVLDGGLLRRSHCQSEHTAAMGLSRSKGTLGILDDRDVLHRSHITLHCYRHPIRSSKGRSHHRLYRGFGVLRGRDISSPIHPRNESIAGRDNQTDYGLHDTFSFACRRNLVSPHLPLPVDAILDFKVNHYHIVRDFCSLRKIR